MRHAITDLRRAIAYMQNKETQTDSDDLTDWDKHM